MKNIVRGNKRKKCLKKAGFALDVEIAGYQIKKMFLLLQMLDIVYFHITNHDYKKEA